MENSHDGDGRPGLYAPDAEGTREIPPTATFESMRVGGVSHDGGLMIWSSRWTISELSNSTARQPKAIARP